MDQRSFRSVLLVIVALVAFSRAQQGVIVEEDDSRLVYSPWSRDWDHFTNPITLNGTTYNNYFHGGGYLAIHTVNASVTLTFNGSYIAYYGDQMDNHGQMRITLDGKITDRSSFSATPVPQAKLFEATVDPNVPNHQITLTCLESKNMGFDYFLFTEATPVIASTDSQTASASQSSTSTQATVIGSSDTASPQTLVSSRNNTPTIVAAVFAGLGWALVLVLCALLIQLRRRRHAIPAARPPVDMDQMSHDQRTITAFTGEPPSSLISDSLMFMPPTPPITKSGAAGRLGPRVLAPSELSSPSTGSSSRPFSQAAESAPTTHVSPPAYSHHG
ncbi:hypothetical protein BKA62DRAFT_691584 [Auriculariales sp. MPI-PUGE-AT-0066]|nr:hypothetical protein BKA62DRAFT_691584 [Auriculariales sp. MPI-PUGE-AT-0066]